MKTKFIFQCFKYYSILNTEYDELPSYTRNYRSAMANLARRHVLPHETADKDDTLIEDLIRLIEQSEERT